MLSLPVIELNIEIQRLAPVLRHASPEALREFGRQVQPPGFKREREVRRGDLECFWGEEVGRELADAESW